PRVEEARADHAARHLLDAEDEHGIVLTARHLGGGEGQGGAAARATRLHVHDRHAGEAQRGEYLVTRRHTARDGATEGSLKFAGPDARIRECVAHRRDAERSERAVREAPERMEADTADVD